MVHEGLEGAGKYRWGGVKSGTVVISRLIDISQSRAVRAPGAVQASVHLLDFQQAAQLAGLVRDAAYLTEAVPLAALRRPPRTALPRPLVARGAAAALGLPSKLYRGTRAAAADRR